MSVAEKPRWFSPDNITPIRPSEDASPVEATNIVSPEPLQPTSVETPVQTIVPLIITPSLVEIPSSEDSKEKKVEQKPASETNLYASMFSEPEGIINKLRHVRQQLRIEQSAILEEESEHPKLTDEEQKALFKAYARKLTLIKGVAEGHAKWKAGKTWNPVEARGNIEKSEEYRFEKKRAISALLQLDAIDNLPTEERIATLELFRNWWGETNEEYENLYKRVERQLQEEQAKRANGEITKDIKESASSALADLSIPISTKVNLLRAAGHSKEEAKKIAKGMVIASIASTVGYFAGNAAAIAAEGAVLGKDILQGFPTWAKFGIAGGLSAGFYGTQFVFGVSSARLVEIKGYALNVFAAGAYHATPFLSRKLRLLAAGSAAVAPDFALELFFLSPTLATQDLALYAAANAAGIGFTAIQTVISENMIRHEKRKERINAEKAVEIKTSTLQHSSR